MIAHLFESTVFAVIAGLLVLALRNNSAAIRHKVWLAASIKFLIPFSLLTSLGARFYWKTTPDASSAGYSVVIEHFTEPHTAAAHVPAPSLLPQVAVALWLLGSLIILIRWWKRWRMIATPLKQATPLPPIDGIEVYASKTLLEPGAFGILRPVLLLPQGIAERLSQAELNAIIAHELCHIRRKDNLSAALHMLVEAAFWFHPLVWWIGARLVDERERACDEDVIRLGSEPRVYAESILRVCEFCLQSPLPCMSGVTGSDLSKRVERIVAASPIRQLGRTKTLALYVLGLASMIAPMGVGLMNSAPIPTQSQDLNTPLPSFEVASIKPTNPEPGGGHGVHFLPGGGIDATSTPLKFLVQVAYHIKDFQLSGASGWMESDTYDITAKPPHQAAVAEARLMLRSMLAERFHLVVHRETKEMQIYGIVTAKNGPKLEPAKGPSSVHDGDFFMDGGHIEGNRTPLTGLAEVLSEILGRPVLDRTGIAGQFDIKLDWTQDESKMDGPSIFTAIQEQLGLKLESQKGPVETIVVDSAQRPSAN